ncbi:MAG: hypothetical protein WCD86_04290 [Ktedonobacteraceae bacterium]
MRQTTETTALKFAGAATFFGLMATAVVYLAIKLADYLKEFGEAKAGTIFETIFGVSPIVIEAQLFALATFLAAASTEAAFLAGIYSAASVDSDANYSSGVVLSKLITLAPPVLSTMDRALGAINRIWNAFPVVGMFSYAISQIPGGQSVAQYFDAADDGKDMAQYVNDNTYASWVNEANTQIYFAGMNAGFWQENPEPCRYFCPPQ